MVREAPITRAVTLMCLVVTSPANHPAQSDTDRRCIHLRPTND